MVTVRKMTGACARERQDFGTISTMPLLCTTKVMFPCERLVTYFLKKSIGKTMNSSFNGNTPPIAPLFTHS